MIENIGEIEKSLGVEEGKLSEMLSSEEKHSVDLSGRMILPKEDYDLRITNIQSESEKKGEELLLKRLKEDNGLDYEGRKDPNNFVTALKAKIEAESKIEPEKRYSDLKSDFEKLQGLKETAELNFTSLQENVIKEKNDFKINSSLIKEIPDNTIIDPKKIVTLLKTEHNFNISDNGIEIIKDGKVLKNESTFAPLTASEFMKDAIKPYLKAVDGGAGGRDNPENFKSGSMEAFDKEMVAKDINIGSEAYSQEMFKRVKDKTLTI